MNANNWIIGSVVYLVDALIIGPGRRRRRRLLLHVDLVAKNEKKLRIRFYILVK